MLRRCVPNLFSKFLFAVGVLCALVSVSNVQAQTYYFPGSNFSYTGGSNSWPFNASTAGGSNMCQWLYLPSDFNTTPPGNLLITTIYIKPSSSVSNVTFPNLSVKLGNTTLTTLTSGTWNSGLTTVYNPSSVSISTTANSWYAITLSTPFYYSGGGLLLEITHGSTSSTGIGWSGLTINQYTVSGRNGRMYGSNASSSSSGSDGATALFGFDAMPANCSGTPLAPVITTAAMNPANPVCGGTTTLTASNPNGSINGLTYQWQSGPASTGPFTNVTSGTGATTLTYTTGSVSATTYFRVGITCTNSSITTWSNPYQVIVGAPQPGAITGNPTFCPGDPATYSVTNVGGTSYTWTLPTGWSGTSTTSSISTIAGASGGTISVTATNSCGTSIPRTYTVVAGSAPAAPTAISGNASVCINSTQTYSVAPVPGATTYTWVLPSGWSGASTTSSITAIVSNSTSTGTITVKANNGCGSSSNTTRTVNVINSLANPGTITSSLPPGNTYCVGGLYSFSINPVPGATAYVWNLPTGWSGTVTGTSVQAFAGSTSGQVQVTAYASCASSATSSLTTNVATSVNPSVSVATSSPAICQGVPTTFTATPTNGGTSPSYVWKKNGNVVIGAGSSYTDYGLVNGDQISVLLASNASCRTTDSVVSNVITASVTPSVTPGIGINSTPLVSICKGTMLNFTTTTTGGGSSPTYQWYNNSIAISGATSTSLSTAAVNNGDTITVQMTTNAACAKFPVATSNKVAVTVMDVVNPTVTINASSTQPIPGQPITFTSVQSGGGATPVYQWILNGVEIVNQSSDTYTSSTLKDGDHIALRMQSYDLCAQPGVVMSNEIIMGSAASVAGLAGWEGTVSLYPNPNGGHFTVAATWNNVHLGETVNVEVLNALGQCVYHGALVPQKAQWRYDVKLADYVAAGQYILRLSTKDGLRASVPLTVNK